MATGVRRVLDVEKTNGAGRGACIGSIVRIEANGDVFVDYRGNGSGAIRARVATTEELKGAAQPVLLVFEDGNPDLPVIAGLVRKGAQRPEPKRSLNLEATGEITIACGKSSITLRSDGRVIVKGTELVSRASGTNKIRGASVMIN